MSFGYRQIALAGAALVTAAPAVAQRGPTIEQQQIAILQQQLAASQAVSARLQQRLDAIEVQLQSVVNRSEESGHRVTMIENTLQQLRTDQDARIAKLETAAEAPPPQIEQTTVTDAPAQPLAKPKPNSATSTVRETDSAAGGPADPGEDAYSEGFRLWEAKRYDQAIASLRAFTSAFPSHRRVSWANNLVGRSLLNKGEPFAAAQAFLANYRSNPKGGRAQDSLYYLGQSLLKYGQPAQACKAYGELISVYGDSVRADLKALLPKARAEANCS